MRTNQGLTRLLNRLVIAIGTSLCQISGAFAQGFPTAPVRIVVPYPPGGSIDAVVRILQPRLNEALGQPIVVEHRAGASGIIGANAVRKAAPDGHTLLFTVSATMLILPFTSRNVDYDTFRDFTPVTGVVSVSGLLLVHPSFPASNYKEFVTELKRSPGKYSYGMTGQGTTYHLLGESLKRAAGIDMSNVPYKGGAPLVTALMANEVPIALMSVSSATPVLKSGRARTLLAIENHRLKDFPDLPALTEFYPDFEKPVEWIGFFGPAGLPSAIRARLFGDIVRASTAPEARPKIEALGLELLGNSPADFLSSMKRDFETYRKMTQDAGVKPE